MDRLRWIKPIAGIHMIKLLRIAAWILTLAVIAHGLQACATKGGDPVECADGETPLEEMLRGAIVKEGSEFAFQIQSVT